MDGIVDPNGSFLDHNTTALLQCLTAPQPEEDVHNVSTLDLQKNPFVHQKQISVNISHGLLALSDARFFFVEFFCTLQLVLLSCSKKFCDLLK